MDLLNIVSLDAFTDAKANFGNLLGSTPDVGGYIIGLIIVVSAIIALGLLFHKEGATMMVIGGIIAVCLSCLLTFWPWWTAILMVIFGAIILFRPIPGMGANGGVD